MRIIQYGVIIYQNVEILMNTSLDLYTSKDGTHTPNHLNLSVLSGMLGYH